jgi:TPR repeat protein
MATIFSVKKVYGKRYLLCFWMLYVVLSVSLYATEDKPDSFCQRAHMYYYGGKASDKKMMDEVDVARIPHEGEGPDYISLLDIVLTDISHKEELDYAGALKNAQHAHDEGDPHGSYILACLYYDGRAVNPEEGMTKRAFDQRRYAEAFALAKKAASGGVAGAFYLLAICYYAGRGVPRNKEMAILYVNKARERGYLPAIELQKFIERMPED